MQGNGGSQCCHGKQYVEHDGEDIGQYRYSAECLLEYIGQCDKDKARTRVRLYPYRECGRKDNEACQYCYKRVYNPYAECCLGQIGFFAEIRSVGAETSHPQAKGEESLSHRTQKYISVHLAEIRFQQKLDTRTSSRQGNRTDYKYQYNNEQSRHHDLGRFLDTFLHAFDNNKMSNQQKQNQPQDRSPRTAGELLEGRDEFCGSLTRKAVRKSFIHILQRPSCHYGIITENQKSCEDSHASHPAPMSAGS